MTKSIAVLPFFERAGREGDPAESYVAGLHGERNAECGVEIRLPAELVERTVLVSAQLSISLAPDGHFVLDAAGLGNATLEAASKAGVAKQTLQSVVKDCLRPELLDGEDDPIADLAQLRGQLLHVLEQLDGATERMKGRKKRE